jgi:hypothetical protein
MGERCVVNVNHRQREVKWGGVLDHQVVTNGPLRLQEHHDCKGAYGEMIRCTRPVEPRTETVISRVPIFGAVEKLLINCGSEFWEGVNWIMDGITWVRRKFKGVSSIKRQVDPHVELHSSV